MLSAAIQATSSAPGQGLEKFIKLLPEGPLLAPANVEPELHPRGYCSFLIGQHGPVAHLVGAKPVEGAIHFVHGKYLDLRCMAA